MVPEMSRVFGPVEKTSEVLLAGHKVSSPVAGD